MDLNYFNALMEQNTIIYRYEVTTIIVPTIKCSNVIDCKQSIFYGLQVQTVRLQTSVIRQAKSDSKAANKNFLSEQIENNPGRD